MSTVFNYISGGFQYIGESLENVIRWPAVPICILLIILITYEANYLYNRDPKLITTIYPDIVFYFLMFQYFIVFLSLISIVKQRKLGGSANLMTTLMFNIKIVFIIFMMIFFIKLVLDIISYIGKFDNAFTMIDIILNSAIIILGLALIQRLFSTNYLKKSKGNKMKSFLNVIYWSVMYIPCMIGDFFDLIAKDFKIAPSGTLLILLIEVFLIFLNFVYPYISKMFYGRDATFIILDKEMLNTKQKKATSKDLIEHYNEANNETYGKTPYKSDDGVTDYTSNPLRSFDYSYSISSWVYLNPQPPSKSRAYNVYTTILNYGNVPRIMYNMKEGKLKIQMETLPQISDEKQSEMTLLKEKIVTNKENVINLEKELRELNNKQNIKNLELIGLNRKSQKNDSDIVKIENLKTDIKSLESTINEKSKNRINSIDDLKTDNYQLEETWGKVKEKKVINDILVTKKFPLQRWNNIVINYNSGTTDIFINGELVKSKKLGINFSELHSFEVGEDNGLDGFIRDVVFYPKTLTKNQISTFYKTK